MQENKNLNLYSKQRLAGFSDDFWKCTGEDYLIWFCCERNADRGIGC